MCGLGAGSTARVCTREVALLAYPSKGTQQCPLARHAVDTLATRQEGLRMREEEYQLIHLKDFPFTKANAILPFGCTSSQQHMRHWQEAVTVASLPGLSEQALLAAPIPEALMPLQSPPLQ